MCLRYTKLLRTIGKELPKKMRWKELSKDLKRHLKEPILKGWFLFFMELGKY